MDDDRLLCASCERMVIPREEILSRGLDEHWWHDETKNTTLLVLQRALDAAWKELAQERSRIKLPR
jgi:hypothetical protein